MEQPAVTADPAVLVKAVRLGERAALAEALNLLDDRRPLVPRQGNAVSTQTPGQ